LTPVVFLRVWALTPGKDHHFRYQFKTDGVLYDGSDPIVFFVR
jgi:hypothetical protein